MSEPQTHAGRVAIVTGAGRGIGAAIARMLAARGAWVAVLDVDRDLAKQTAKAFGGFPLECDVANRDQVAAACEAAEKELGPADILVNNAGISPKTNGRALGVHEMPFEEWDQVVAVNLTGAFAMIRALAPGMIARKAGRIVNQASVAGKTYTPIVACHYTATKAALIGLTKHLAGELGPHGITVNALCPGRIATDLAKTVDPRLNQQVLTVTPMDRFGTAEDVARTACYLTGPDAEFVTGQAVDIAGGWMMT
ncbi:SDR family oxidoreductase [Plastoroseomonas hellenica]|uniref:SDR family oxidoreductase n=1 Tax=Plastoroseomonas hellenica TaxID=2687306 RepID=UPI00201355A9|nr:SDR family NAD(P)-dependent oxidoreductase [Plastoroseomonas hellenica]